MKNEKESMLKHLDDEIEMARNERAHIVEQYEEMKKLVVGSILIAAGLIIIYETLIQWIVNQRKFPSLRAMGLYIQPVIFLGFFVMLIIAMVKGFDWLSGSDTKIGRKLSEKSKELTISQRLENLQSTIIVLEGQKEKLLHGDAPEEFVLQDLMEETGPDPSYADSVMTQTAAKIDAVGEEARRQVDAFLSEKEEEDEWASLFMMDERESQKFDSMDTVSESEVAPASQDTSFLYEDDDEDESMEELWRREGMHRPGSV